MPSWGQSSQSIVAKPASSERRLANDGKPYTEKEFQEFDAAGYKKKWDSAQVSVEPAASGARVQEIRELYGATRKKKHEDSAQVCDSFAKPVGPSNAAKPAEDKGPSSADKPTAAAPSNPSTAEKSSGSADKPAITLEALPSPSTHVVWDEYSIAWTAYLPSEHDHSRALPDRIAAKLRRAEMDGSLCWFVLPNALAPDDIHLAESALQSKVEIAASVSM